VFFFFEPELGLTLIFSNKSCWVC